MKTIHIWNIKINPLTKQEIVNQVFAFINSGGKGFHLTGVNPETIVKAQSDPQLTAAILDSDIVNIDNMLVVSFLRLLGFNIRERAACPDIFELFLARAAEQGLPLYFLGAKPEIIEKMVLNLRDQYPGIIIAGYQHGYYQKDNEEMILAEIRRLVPAFLFLGLPTPQKEMFILNNKHILNVGCCFGVGGAFDVKAGVVHRAPAWLRNIGLEGIHRVLQNPANYGSRAIKTYLPFLKLFITEIFQRKRTITNSSSDT